MSPNINEFVKDDDIACRRKKTIGLIANRKIIFGAAGWYLYEIRFD